MELGGETEGQRERDLRIDRWSSCVWPGGYAQAKSRSFIPPSHVGLLPAMDRGRKEVQRLAFLDCHGLNRAEHREETPTSLTVTLGNL